MLSKIRILLKTINVNFSLRKKQNLSFENKSPFIAAVFYSKKEMHLLEFYEKFRRKTLTFNQTNVCTNNICILWI